jgi:hypothetical protein
MVPFIEICSLFRLIKPHFPAAHWRLENISQAKMYGWGIFYFNRREHVFAAYKLESFGVKCPILDCPNRFPFEYQEIIDSKAQFVREQVASVAPLIEIISKCLIFS